MLPRIQLKIYTNFVNTASKSVLLPLKKLHKAPKCKKNPDCRATRTFFLIQNLRNRISLQPELQVLQEQLRQQELQQQVLLLRPASAGAKPSWKA